MPDLTAGMHPNLIEKVNKILAKMQAAGHPMRICQGFRTAEVQAALYAQGRTKPGPKVTNCDGIKKKSNHQSGKAVDCCFLGADPFGEHQPWDLYGKFGKEEGLEWGGDWKSRLDRPHLEMV